jgi:hypothetical protein
VIDPGPGDDEAHRETLAISPREVAMAVAIRDRLAGWFARWKSGAGIQGPVIRSQAERWRAVRGVEITVQPVRSG